MTGEGTKENCEKWAIPIRKEGPPELVYSSDELADMLDLHNKTRCDCMAHYPKCPWLVIEKKPAGKIPHAVEQIKATIEAARNKGYEVKYALLVYSGKFGRIGQIFEPRKSDDSPTGYVIYRVQKRNVQPINLSNNIKLWALDERKIDEYKANVRGKLDYYQD
jgi:hypothetical protein